MATDAARTAARFQPQSYASFRFVSRSIDAHGDVELRYALDDRPEFVERLRVPVPGTLDARARERVEGLLALLHWVAGVSYFKAAAPPRVSCETGAPPPACARLLEALYSEGLGEFAYTNGLPALPRPRFGAPSPPGQPAAGTSSEPAAEDAVRPAAATAEPRRVLVPVGGGKDSAVALEIVRRAGVEAALFTIGDAPAIARTVAVAGLPRLLATRTLDPALLRLNAEGALNGHVPVTAIVSCAALLTAALNGFDAVAMANERSASSGNVVWDGIEVNHQFSKGLRAEHLLAAAAAEQMPAGPRPFSILRPASELAIARAFARMEPYHDAFTSCNAIFRHDPELRAASWCCECPKCRFVFLALAPFSEPAHLRAIFGRDLLAEEEQLEGFALLAASGGHKPFECVGEEQESLAAMRLLALDPRWREHVVVRRLAEEVLARRPASDGDPAQVLALSGEHSVPDVFMPQLDALLRP